MQRLRTMHLFAGAGGGILADVLFGHQPVCAVEINEYCQQVLSARQKDGFLPWFPIFDDVQKFDGRPWRGIVDVVAGGFPCQDISVAGKGAGIDGERSGLWSEMARIISEVRPRYAFVENSPALITRGLGRVIGDLAAIGYDCRWGVLGAADVGAPHQRDRLWIVARYSSPAWEKCGCCDEFWCNIHDMHTFECDCPPIEYWISDPYVSYTNCNSIQGMEYEPQQGGHERQAGLYGRTGAIHPWTEDPPMRLNPDWVEWLMGWPIGWTDLKPLETGKSHYAP